MDYSTIIKGQSKYLPAALGVLITSGFLPSFTVSSHAAIDDDSRQNDSTTPVHSDLRTLFTRTSALWSNPQWQAFKMLWRKLDAVTPTDKGYVPGFLNAEEAGRFRNELDVAIGELREVSEEIGIDSVELALLEILTFARFDYLSYGSQSLLTRMMMPPVTEQTDSLIPQIEARIDTVIKLRESGLITGEEMAVAFENMISCIDTYCVLEIFNRGIVYSPRVYSFRWPEEVSDIRTAFDSIRTASLAEIERDGEVYEGQYQETYDALKIIENDLRLTIAGLPSLNDLLIDLELF